MPTLLPWEDNLDTLRARRRPLRLLAAPLLVGLLAAACGNGDSGISVDDDREALEESIAAFEATLREDGFTAGEEDEEEDDDFKFRSEECKSFDALFGEDEFPASTTDLESKELERGELSVSGGVAETAQASVALVRDEDDIDAFFMLLRDERLEPCLQEAVEVEFQEQSSQEGEELNVADVRITLPEPPSVGDDSFAVRLTGRFELPDSTFPFSFVFDFASEGRAIALVWLGAVGAESTSVESRPLLADLLTNAM